MWPPLGLDAPEHSRLLATNSYQHSIIVNMNKKLALFFGMLFLRLYLHAEIFCAPIITNNKLKMIENYATAVAFAFVQGNNLNGITGNRS